MIIVKYSYNKEDILKLQNREFVKSKRNNLISMLYIDKNFVNKF